MCTLLSFYFIQIRHQRFPVDRHSWPLWRTRAITEFILSFQVLVERAEWTVVDSVTKEI